MAIISKKITIWLCNNHIAKIEIKIFYISMKLLLKRNTRHDFNVIVNLRGKFKSQERKYVLNILDVISVIVLLLNLFLIAIFL